jgi:integrase
MASGGLRISEVVTLTPGQENRLCGLRDRQNGYRGQESAISVEAYEAIREWLNVRPVASGWIFTGFGGRGDRDPRTNHIHQVSAWELVKPYAAKCGYTSVKPHDFRRFVGTTLAKNDPRQAQKALGHKDINSTYKSYVLDELEVGLTDGLF